MPTPHHLIALAACLVAGACSAQTAVELRALIDDWDAWHAERIQRLAADDGWLTLIDLAFLEDGEATIGRAEGSDLRYEHLTADRIGRIVKVGDSVRFEADAGTAVTADGRPIETIALVADDQGPPTVLRNGPVSITLVRRAGALALRVRDNQSPVRLEFPSVERFPFDASLRVPARVEVAREGESISVTDVLGHTADMPLAATLVFEIDGREHRLDATEGGSDSYFIVFGDTTNGASTHGGGRFLGVPVGDDGSTIIDFNRAYNPPCAFTGFSTCPLPTPDNRLPIPIAAGERAPAAPSPER